MANISRVKPVSAELFSIFTVAVALFCAPLTLAADPIQADRPGFSTGTATVAPDFAHLELGIQSSYGNNVGDPDTFTAPLLNVRLGLTPNTELNILVDGWSRERTGTSTTTTAGDVLVGVKHRLLVTESYNWSFLGFVSLPTGNSTDSGNFSPFLGLLWDYELSPDISAFGTFQFVSFVENNQRSTNFQPAIGLNFSHTAKISTFIEYYRDQSLNLDTSATNTVDAGVAYLLTREIQLDINIGYAIDRKSDDFIGAGFAIRF